MVKGGVPELQIAAGAAPTEEPPKSGDETPAEVTPPVAPPPQETTGSKNNKGCTVGGGVGALQLIAVLLGLALLGRRKES
jgi:hypothetical protein